MFDARMRDGEKGCLYCGLMFPAFFQFNQAFCVKEGSTVKYFCSIWCHNARTVKKNASTLVKMITGLDPQLKQAGQDSFRGSYAFNVALANFAHRHSPFVCACAEYAQYPAELQELVLAVIKD